MDAFRQALRDAKATATHLSNEIVPKLNKPTEFADAVTEAETALDAIRSAIGTLPDEIGSNSQSKDAKNAVIRSANAMTSSLQSGVGSSVPDQDLTFRDKASEIKNGLTKLEEAAEREADWRNLERQAATQRARDEAMRTFVAAADAFGEACRRKRSAV